MALAIPGKNINNFGMRRNLPSLSIPLSWHASKLTDDARRGKDRQAQGTHGWDRLHDLFHLLRRHACRWIKLHQLPATNMGNSSSSSKISAQDKYVASILPHCQSTIHAGKGTRLISPQGYPGHEEPTRQTTSIPAAHHGAHG